MLLAEKIQQNVQQLPAAVQAEVLDFIEYLLTKTEQREEKEWSGLSLAVAMRGLETEESPL